jgi:xylulokinase
MIEAVLGFDVGTTAVKAGLFRLDSGRPLGMARRAYPTLRPAPGWVEQDPLSWLTAMAECWRELHNDLGPFALRAVGVCSQVNTHLLVGADLLPLGNAIVWQDVRAASDAAALDARITADERVAFWGGPFKIDASFALARLAWMRRREPSVAAAGRWLLAPKDYCVASLCGTVVTDIMSPIGLVGADGTYVAGVTDLVEGSASMLPPVRQFDDLAGYVQADNPVGLPEGVPVAVGSMDAWGNVYGSGVVRPGQAMEVAGTSEIIGVLSDHSEPTDGVISFLPFRGLHLHAGPTQAGGDALAWAARCFGLPIERFLRLAAEGRRDAQPVVFLPHLSGERAPIWNPDARGVFLGVSASTELRHLALAVLEGVAFAGRQLMEACESAAGLRAAEVRLSGGGARSDLWNRIKASTQGRPLHVLQTLDSGVVGAALMGAVAADLRPSLEEAAMHGVAVSHVVEPEPNECGRLDHLYGIYRESYDSLVGVFSKLARSIEEE